MARQAEREKQEAISKLRKFLHPGDTIWTDVKHVARSGMSRSISAHTIDNNYPWDISYLIADAIGLPLDRHLGGIKIRGCGMDMGFEIVYQLGHAMFPNGTPCVGQTCNSNDHFNRVEAPTQGPWAHRDGGYTFKQHWL